MWLRSIFVLHIKKTITTKYVYMSLTILTSALTFIQFDHPAKPGDLIQIFRGSYEHWAVYIGRNKVVHLLPASECNVVFSSSILKLFLIFCLLIALIL